MRTRTFLPFALLCAPAATQLVTGAEAPDIDFKDTLNFDGSLDSVAKLSDLRGRVVILDFFATW
jgi:hypothetical protein